MAKTIMPILTNTPNNLSTPLKSAVSLPRPSCHQPRISRMNADEYRRYQSRRQKRDQDSTDQYQSAGHVPYTYEELLNMDFRPAPWLLTGLIRVNEVFMTYAGTGVGKTWFTLSIAMVAAGGGKLLDWSNDSPKRVLYLDGEMDAGELVGRMKQLASGLQCDPEALKKNFVLCSRQMQKSILGNFIEIETEESQFGILAYAEAHKFDVIVIDNLTTLSGQIDENASKDLKQFNTFLLRAKQRGIAVLVVHHQGKGKDSGPRGSTAMIATLNLLLKLEPSTQEREAGDKDARFTIVFEKIRGSIDSRPLPVVLTATAFDDEFFEKKTDDGDVPSPLMLIIDPDADSNAERAKKLLQTGRYKTQAELAKAFGVKQPAMSKILAKAVAQGVLTKTAVADAYARAKQAGEMNEEREQEVEDF